MVEPEEARQQLTLGEVACRSASPAAIATMWSWITEDRAQAERLLRDVLAPLLRRDPDQLSGQVCIGGRQHCLELLGRFAEAGCERVYLWPLGDEPRQLEIAGAELLPHLVAAGPLE